MVATDLEAMKARIDAIRWYHEFDFGHGLTTTSGSAEHIASHRRIWRFIERNLDLVDFRGKSVLDIGCWDGYWSFAAERRGAASVLATDDLSQNWSVGQGIHLAKELLGSKIEIDLNRSIYNIGGRGQKFDVILCLGVYYHLHDPYYAFSQLRHCCHEDTVVLIEGNIANHLPALTARCKFGDQANEFCPELAYLVQLLRATYLEPVTIDGLESAGPVPTPTFTTPAASAVRLNRRWRLQMIRAAIGGKWDEIRKLIAAVDPPPDLESCTRVLFKCAPFRGPNSIHAYSPPFGLEVYDPRFHSTNSE